MQPPAPKGERFVFNRKNAEKIFALQPILAKDWVAPLLGAGGCQTNALLFLH